MQKNPPLLFLISKNIEGKSMIRIILTDICYLLKKQWHIYIVLVLSIACSFLVFSMMTGVINYEISAAKKISAFHTFSIDLNQHEVEHLSSTIRVE